MLAYSIPDPPAITVHKSQGLTLLKAVLNLDRKEHCLGLTYVGCSRVTNLAGLMFESPFDFERFKPKESLMAKDRGWTWRIGQSS